MAKTTKGTPAEYNDQSITALKGADRVRKRPAVIFGSDGLEGCQHSFFEILANSVDEAREGHGKKILVTVFRDRSIEVEDAGRGIPLGWNEKEGRYNWELIFCEMYAGGKYDNNGEGAAYEYSLGLNGLGACATQYSSTYMEVRSYNGQTLSEISFRRGEPASELSVRELTPTDKKRRGTIIRWMPDLEVFTDIAIPIEFYETTLHRQAVVNAGITFVLRVEGEKGGFTEKSYCFPNGLMDYVGGFTEGNALTAPVLWHLETRGRDREDKPEYKLKADIIFCLSNTTARTEYYHNSSYLEYGGAPSKAVKLGFTGALDQYIRAQGKYNKNESKITFDDIEECLVVIINSASTQTSYENQTKKAINNTFIAKALTEFIKQKLEIYFAEKPTEAAIFATQALTNKRSRERAEENRIDIKKKLAGSIDLANRVEKFVDCRSKDPAVRELYIVEGDSALGSCKQGRSAEYQAIIPIRGKTLNCMKSTYAKIFDSKIICDLLRVIGCGVEIEGKVKGDMVKFDMKNLRWRRIIICTDADEDGFQIRTLLLTLFYRLLPTLINEQRIFIAESPLFEITAGDDIYFAYNENEKTEILKMLGNRRFTIQRSKGLGENNADMMWQTTMNPATRRLVAVSPADAEATAYMFETLMGDELQERKRFIAENGHRYIKDADI
ncbi:MAG: DNA topoisomerase [Clostridia bacterium]|nr:DNA topoisomerase [Clostridia bacterium]